MPNFLPPYVGFLALPQEMVLLFGSWSLQLTRQTLLSCLDFLHEALAELAHQCMCSGSPGANDNHLRM